jgi:hypothetical protein
MPSMALARSWGSVPWAVVERKAMARSRSSERATELRYVEMVEVEPEEGEGSAVELLEAHPVSASGAWRMVSRRPVVARR